MNPSVRARGQGLVRKLTPDEQRAFATYQQPLSTDPNAGVPLGFTLYPLPSTVVTSSSSELMLITIVTTDGIEHVLPPKFDLARAEAIAKRQANFARRRSFMLTALAAWIIPPMAIYILGWSVAWIRRGFV